MAEPFLQEFCCACSFNGILVFHFRSDLTFTVVQVGMRYSIYHGHEILSLWVPRLGPKLPDWRYSPPTPRLDSTDVGEGSTWPRFPAILLTSSGSVLTQQCLQLGPPLWGRTGTQSARYSLHKYSPAQRLLHQAWRQQRLSMDFLSWALGNAFSFIAHHITGRVCANANPHGTRGAPVTKCHKHHTQHTRQPPWECHIHVTPRSPPCYTQCSANTVPCGTDLLHSRGYSRGQKQHFDMLIFKMPVATSQR